MSAPRFVVLPAVIFAVGLGMAMHYGYELYSLRSYSETELVERADLNLAQELNRSRRPPPTDGATLEILRVAARHELEGGLIKQRRDLQLGFAVGLIAAVLSLGQMVLMKQARRL